MFNLMESITKIDNKLMVGISWTNTFNVSIDLLCMLLIYSKETSKSLNSILPGTSPVIIK